MTPMPVLVQRVDEVHEVVRRAEARRRRVVADHLIAPGAGERMLHNGHQFDVRVAHPLDVRHQLVGQFAVGKLPIVFSRIHDPR